MRVALQTLGCRVNEAEVERWSREFKAAGHQIVGASGDPELVVFNSCAVTQDAVRKSRGLLRRIHREQPSARLVISGCYATLNPSEAETLGVDLIIPNADKDRLVEIVERDLDIGVMPSMAADPDLGSLLPSNRQRAFVKVQDGCRYRCTFCIVTVARGDERSRPVESVVEEIQAFEAHGVQEIVLTGVHLGGYGSEHGYGLDHLVRAILDRTRIRRVRFGSLEPWDLPDAFIELFGDRRLMPHLHLPLQSGCDATLRRMARRCRTRDFRQLLERIRLSVPGVNITTDIIVGFPGETGHEWRESLAFIAEAGFGHIHIFPYSHRAGTKAAGLPDPIDPTTQKARCSELRELSERMRAKFQRQFVGQHLEVLIEGDTSRLDRVKRFFGYTPNYLRVALDTGASESFTVNNILSVELTGVDCHSGALSGRPAPAAACSIGQVNSGP